MREFQDLVPTGSGSNEALLLPTTKTTLETFSYIQQQSSTFFCSFIVRHDLSEMAVKLDFLQMLIKKKNKNCNKIKKAVTVIDQFCLQNTVKCILVSEK